MEGISFQRGRRMAEAGDLGFGTRAGAEDVASPGSREADIKERVGT